VGQGPEYDEDMPDGMVERVLFVLVKEIRADGIEDPFGDDPRKSGMRHILPHRPYDEQRRPAHHQVEREGQVRMFAQRDDLTYHTGYHACPEKTEQTPTHPSADYREADRRVRTRDHDVDRDMIEDTDTGFRFRGYNHMIEGGSKIH